MTLIHRMSTLAQARRQKGYIALMARHTYAHRARTLLKHLGIDSSQSETWPHIIEHIDSDYTREFLCLRRQYGGSSL